MYRLLCRFNGVELESLIIEHIVQTDTFRMDKDRGIGILGIDYCINTDRTKRLKTYFTANCVGHNMGYTDFIQYAHNIIIGRELTMLSLRVDGSLGANIDFTDDEIDYGGAISFVY